MNLWAKRTGQLLVAVLLLMSCEDDSFLLGFKNQNRQFNVAYHEFTFENEETSVMLIDSIITDHFAVNDPSSFRFLLGQYNDPSFGTVRSEVYTQFLPPFGDRIENATTDDFDSLTFQFELDRYYYGHFEDSEEKYTIHELLDTLSFYERYYYNSIVPYNPTPLVEATFLAEKFDLNETGGSKRLLIKAKLPRTDEWAFGLFDYAIKNDSLGNPVFRNKYKGLAIIPSSQNKYILGVSPASTESRVTLHYHKDTTKLVRYFLFDPQPPAFANSFSKISTQRTGDLASLSQPYETYAPPSGLRYIQSGSPVVTKLDLSKYYDFIRGNGLDGEDSLKKILINSAELSIGVEEPPQGFSPPSQLILRVLKKESTTKYLFMNSILDADSTAMHGFRLAGDGRYYVASGDEGSYLVLSYNKDKGRYIGHPSLFLQNLFDRKEVDVDVAYFALFPVSPTMGKSVNRVVLDQADIKLGIYYTKINLPNLE